MRASMFEAFDAPLRVVEIDEPACPRDGVIAKVEACGVCRSDHHAWKGVNPNVKGAHVPGHEFAGVVVEVGPDCKRFSKGDRVTAPFILGCGQCRDCRSGDAPLCADQFLLGFHEFGAFAEYVAAPRADFNLAVLPDSLGFVAAASLGCRVTTAYRALVERGKLMPGERLVVHGAGGVGLACVQIAVAMGAEVIAIDLNDKALDLAKKVGANAVLNVRGLDHVGEAVRELTNGGVDVAIDALGVSVTFENALRSLRRGGRSVQIGMPTGKHARPTIPLLELIYARQLSLIGTRGFAAHGFPDLFRMIEAGRIDPEALVTARLALDEAGAALKAMDSYDNVGVAVIDRFAA